jgi:hypothetical protein
MKKLLILCILMLTPLMAQAERYTPNNPPKTIEFNEPIAKYFFDVAGGCVYLYTLQYKHAAMANLLDSSQTSADWMKNAKEQSDTWITLAKIMQGILEKGFNIPESETQEYKMGQYHNLNIFFSELFMTSIPQDYFTRILNSTSYCVMNQNGITSFIDLSIEKIKSSPDKPKKRM